jgi:undecaprenyl-diphosphatase
VLGIVQGLTEFLPISSTAHLRIVPALLGWKDPGAAASAVIQLGTTAALLLYFRKDLASLLAGSLRGSRRELRLATGIALGTAPIVVLGLLGKPWIEGDLRSLWVIAGALAFFGVLLGVADRVAAAARRSAESIGIGDAVFVGLAQSLALIPGASRSGVTMTGAFFLGLERGAAARFSFLLSIPAVAAAGLYELWKEREALGAAGAGALAVATLVSGVVGYASLEGLLRFLRTRSALPFVVYRIALAAALAALLTAGKL